MAAVSICCLFSSCHSKKDAQKDFVLDTTNLKSLDKAIQLNPKDPELYFLRATFHYNHKNIKDAESDILQAIKLKDNVAKYYVCLSDVNFAQRQTDLAEENLEKALAIDKNYNEARLKLAELYYFQKQYDRCIKVVDEASKLNAHNPTAYLIKSFCYKDLGDTANYLRMLYLVKDQNPKEVKAHLELGYFYQNKKDVVAIDHYKNALSVDPKNEEILYNLSQCYMDFGDVEHAKAYYNQLVSLGSKSRYAENALYNLGYISASYDNDGTKAIEYFSRAIKTNPGFIEAYAARGEVYEQMGNDEQARADYKQCLTLSSNYEPAIQGLNSLDKNKKK